MNNMDITKSIFAEYFLFRPDKEVVETIRIVHDGINNRDNEYIIRLNISEMLGIKYHSPSYRVIPPLVRILTTQYNSDRASEIERFKLRLT